MSEMPQESYVAGFRDHARNESSHAQWYCLNGASCFAIRVHDSVLYNCWCLAGFHGPRCDFKYVNQPRATGQSNLDTTELSQTATRDPSANESIFSNNIADEVHQPSYIKVSYEQPGQQKWLYQHPYASTLLFAVIIVLILLFLVISFSKWRSAAGGGAGRTDKSDQGATTMGRFIKVVSGQKAESVRATNNRQINYQDRRQEAAIELEIIGLQLRCLHQANHSSSSSCGDAVAVAGNDADTGRFDTTAGRCQARTSNTRASDDGSSNHCQQQQQQQHAMEDLE